MISIVLLSVVALLPGNATIAPVSEISDLSLTGETASMVWNCPSPQDLELPDGLAGFTISGCGYAGTEGQILLPSRSFYFPIPSGSEPTLTVVPRGIHALGHGRVGAVTVTSAGIDSFFTADLSELPVEWGRISHSGSFRRAGVAILELHPVITGEGGELLYAEMLEITLSYPEGTSAPRLQTGADEAVSSLLEGDAIWQIPLMRRGQSPFWGHPWAALHVDTAGIYGLSGADLPDAVGHSSATLSMFCGRGREMGEEPWETEYIPFAVPIIVEDGGDGVFDTGDSLFFFARGLSWWNPENTDMPEHFGHRYSTQNVYWLTWGGETGVRMDVVDGSLTGAPALPDSFLARRHFEQNLYHTRTPEDIAVNMPDDWAWDRNSGSSSQWLYYGFDSESALGEGYIRVHMKSPDAGIHKVQFALNGTLQCDTSWSDMQDFICAFPVSGIKDQGNTLGVHIIRDGSEEVFFDWFEVFPWTSPNLSAQAQVPIESWSGTDRRRFTWENGLAGTDVYLVGGDTLAARITVEDSQSFEFTQQDGWKMQELWIVQPGSIARPELIRFPTPGRIIGNLTGEQTLFVVADQFVSDAAVLVEGIPGAELLAASEIYDEFNGGVHDPSAIRALASYAVDSWDPVPADIVLVGGGTWDPRNFISTRESFIDILYRGSSYLVSDDVFAIVRSDSILPQIGLSRIGVGGNSDLRLLVSKTLEYRSGVNRGDWQTVVLGAADDERTPLHGGDERYHTESVERILTNHLPAVIRPEKLYLIFYDWNDFWKKPEAREDYIAAWSRGSLISLYLGHGSYDQIADEGLLYLEDAGLLACEGRLPVALFGSCSVGDFMNPALSCLAQAVTVSPVGGAITSLGATDQCSGLANEQLVASILDRLFTERDISMGMCMLLGKLDAGYSTNSAMYILFGDGSTPLAYPGTSFHAATDTLRTGEYSTLSGVAPDEGLVLIEAFESCQPDTYFTFRQHRPLAYLSPARCFFRGSAPAQEEFSTEVFVPIDAVTGSLSRTQFLFLNTWMIAAASTYPAPLLVGSPASGDTTGPDIELWVQGYRNTLNPSVTGTLTVRAILSDPSGINLLGGTGRQLALYIDGTAQDVSEYFRYNQGSGVTGEITVEIGSLEQGEHQLELRASDGLLNRSSAAVDLTVTSESDISLSDAFPYPNPCSDGVALNWTQSALGAVDLSVFTVSGRRLLHIRNIEGVSGYNQYWWDCTDADGDPVSSGSYIFQVRVVSSGASGESSSTRSIIALIHGSSI